MPYSNDIATDSLTFDGGQAVTLNQKRAGAVNSITVRNATSRQLGEGSVFSFTLPVYGR